MNAKEFIALIVFYQNAAAELKNGWAGQKVLEMLIKKLQSIDINSYQLYDRKIIRGLEELKNEL